MILVTYLRFVSNTCKCITWKYFPCPIVIHSWELLNGKGNIFSSALSQHVLASKHRTWQWCKKGSAKLFLPTRRASRRPYATVTAPSWLVAVQNRITEEYLVCLASSIAGMGEPRRSQDTVVCNKRMWSKDHLVYRRPLDQEIGEEPISHSWDLGKIFHLGQG